MAGKAIYEIFQIPNTANPPSGAMVDDYSGWCVDPSGRVISAAAGGHSDSSVNAVVSCNLMLDAPVWTTLCAPSLTPQGDVAYYPDGKPTSRHLYHSIQYVPSVNRVMLFGCRFAWTSVSTQTFTTTDGFNLATNTWDVAGTWADCGPHNGGSVVAPDGKIWTANTARKFDPATNTWSTPTTGSAPLVVRYPWATDTTRSQMFGLAVGSASGEGASDGLIHAVRNINGALSQISFNTSAARSQFITDDAYGPGMDYDPNNDQFLFYDGTGSKTGRIYSVKPNSTATWDMSILAVTGSAVQTLSAGIMSRWTYVPQIKAFVFMPSRTSNIHVMRVA